MEPELLLLLENTQSPVADTRHSAEHQLANLYRNPAFALSLAAVASYESVPTNLRQSALSVLRNLISTSWSPLLDDFEGQVLVSDDVKAQVRQILLELATANETTEHKVKAAASYAVSKIASADFPDQWPQLLPSLLHIINNPSSSDSALRGALRVLLDLVDVGFSEEQFFNVACDLVSALFAVTTNESTRPIVKALALLVFHTSFDTLEMVLEQHRSAVKQFMDEILGQWSPFFITTLRAPLPQPPTEEEESKEGPVPSQWRGAIALKLQVVKVKLTPLISFPSADLPFKTLMKVRIVFPGLLATQSLVYFSILSDELSALQSVYDEFYIDNEHQGRLEDVDGLPYTLDFLVMDELDLMQSIVKAPPVKAELQKQLQNAEVAGTMSTWLPEIMKLITTYGQITSEDEGLWDVDVNLFLSEETSVTAHYEPRTGAADLIIKLGEWLKGAAAEAVLAHMSIVFADSSSSYVSTSLPPFVYLLR